MRAERLIPGAGIAASLAALALIVMEPRDALTGWLAAAAAFAGVPAGALCLQAMMRLIPGTWGEQMRLSCEAGATLTFPALIAFLPVLGGMGLIYPEDMSASPFHHFWMEPVARAARALLWFGLLAGAERLFRARWHTRKVATLFLILFALLGSFVAVDWLMALEPDFASSSFGLTILILWTGMALAALLLLRLPRGRSPGRVGVLGALLLTLLLLWAYIQFLSFFINWSPGLPEGAAYYGRRMGGGWTLVVALFGLLGLAPLLLLILPRFRRSKPWLIVLSASVLMGKVIEFGWLALPGRGSVAIAAFVLSAAGLALIAAALLPQALRRRIAARRPA